LISYFVVNNEFLIQKEKQEVLGASSVRGIWVSSNTEDCPQASIVDASGCIKRDFFKEYNRLNKQELFFNDQGHIIFSNDHLFVSGMFTVKKVVDNELWSNLRVGSLNLKINDSQWVLEDVVWNKDSPQPVISLIQVNSNYLVILHPSVTLNGLGKQFWAFEYKQETESIRSLSFSQEEGNIGFVDSSYFDVLTKDDTVFLKFERVDPALMGSREVVLYEYSKNFEFIDRYILKVE
jgi:hypothetical protein